MISAGEPTRVNVSVPDPVTVTLPPLVADKVPSLAVKATVKVSPLTSVKLTPERSTFDGVSSSAVTVAGIPDADGDILKSEFNSSTAPASAGPPLSRPTISKARELPAASSVKPADASPTSSAGLVSSPNNATVCTDPPLSASTPARTELPSARGAVAANTRLGSTPPRMLPPLSEALTSSLMSKAVEEASLPRTIELVKLGSTLKVTGAEKMPPPEDAKFPVTVLWVMLNLAAFLSRKMPPPRDGFELALLAKLPLTVVLVMVVGRLALIPPPFVVTMKPKTSPDTPIAELSLTVLPDISNELPKLASIPPPSELLEFPLTVLPLMLSEDWLARALTVVLEMPPPRLVAEFPLMMLSLMINLAANPLMPPPSPPPVINSLLVEFSLTVLLFKISVPPSTTLMPPPSEKSPPAKFPLSVLSLIVSVPPPSLETPPPSASKPLVEFPNRFIATKVRSPA